GEKDDFINKKVHAVLAAGLKPILCVGETLAENEAGQTEAVLERQIKAGLQGVSAEQIAKVVIAYEPVWAIGTGRAATSADAQNRCAFIRGELRKLYGALADEVRIQYGGSVTAANAKEILSQPDIDGALVGGASLKTADFKAIVEAA
ncbi:MAG TPA: triose-phosphate isomerase, partial [Thermoflexales bacterium]|nr:triose-phosphate isomerase [Thermoflexales bacterium]